jgi:hypothetical protein
MESVKQVEIGREIKVGGFKEAYHSLPYKLMPQAKEDICSLCYWNAATFQAKLRGKRPFRVFEIKQIENYFEKFNINAWTGEPLANN